jgi:hypothetical protein
VYKLGILILFFGASCFAEPCDQTDSAQKLAKTVAQANDKLEKSPFLVACKEPPDLLKNRPKTGLFVRSVMSQDQKGLQTKELLRRVLQKVKDRIAASENQIKNIITCLGRSTPECAELKNWADVELPKYVKESRYHLSLAQSSHELKTWLGSASSKVNEELDTLGSYKLNKWDALTEEEKDKSQKQLNDYKKEISAVADAKVKSKEICKLCKEKFSSDALIAVRLQHFQEYHRMISELPVLQYLKSAKVTNADLKTAFSKMQEDLNEEKNQIKELEDQLNQNPLPTDVLKILNYNSFVEETLLEDDRYCGLATSLLFTMSNREIGNGLAIGLPIMAASFFAAPAVIALGGSAALATATSVGVGAVGGGAFTLKSYNEFKETQSRALGHIYGDSLGSDQIAMDMSSRRLTYDVVTLPVGFGLGGMLLRGAVVNTKALLAARGIFKATN